MTIKYILAVALITPFLTVSSMAQQYSGGPKSSVAPTRQISSGADIYAQGVGGDIYAQERAISTAGSQRQQIPRLSRWPEDCRSAR